MKLNLILFGDIDYAGIENNQYIRWNPSGGGSVFIDGHEYLIQFPTGGVNEDTTFYVAGRGSGGIDDTYSTLDAAKGQNVIVIAPVHQGTGDYSGSINVANQLAEHYGIEPTVSFSGHSNSGPQCMAAAQQYIQSTGNPTTIILNDPSVEGGNDSGIDYSVFKDSVIVAYAPIYGGATANFMDRLQKAAANGATVIMAYYDQGDHGSADEIAAAMGAYDPENMTLLDSLTYASSDGARTTNMSYAVLGADGKLYKFNNLEEAQAFYDEAMSNVGLSVEKLRGKYDNLSDFSKHFGGRKNDTLASNLCYVSDSMNNIKSQIVEHKDMNYQGSQGEAAIIGAMYSAADYYGAVTSTLYGNLSAEADAVYSIANEIYKMDQAGSMMSESTLTDGIKGLYSSNSTNMSSALETLKTTSANLYDTAKAAVTAGGRYDSLTTVLSASPAAGTVGKISISSLESAIDSIVPVLDQGVAEANALKASVTDFMSGIGSSNILQGDIWDEVKTNMGHYSNLLECDVKASQYISDALKVAMGAVTKYIQDAESSIAAVNSTKYGEYAAVGELDDSKLPAITTTIRVIQNDIDALEERIEAIERANAACEAAPEPKSCTITDTSGLRATLQEYKNTKEILDTYKGILEGFAPVVADAQRLINDAINDVKNMYENPVKDTEGNLSFLADFNLDLSSYDALKDSASNYIGLIDDYYAARHPQETVATETETPPTTQNPTGTPQYPSGTQNPSGGNPSGGSPTQSAPTTQTPTTQTPTTQTPTSTKEDEEAKKKAEEAAKKKAEEEAKQKAEAEAARKAAEEAAKQGKTQTTTTQTTTDEEARRAAEEAARRAAEAAAAQRTATSTRQTGSGVTPTSSTPSTDDGLARLGVDTKPTNYNTRPGGYTNYPGEVGTDDIVTDEPIIEEPVITEPSTVEDYTEPTIVEPIIDEPATIKEVEQEQPKENSAVKTMGIAAGIGLAVGAAALGAHTLAKEKDDEDIEEDYGYDK